jgi:rhodanese-related sulfurtransferase
MTLNRIHPRDLLELVHSRSAEIIDVRTPMEFQEVHVQGARNIPLDRLDPMQLQRELANSAQKLIVICRSGARGQKGCEKLLAAGFAEVLNVEGGTLACIEAGLPVVRGKQVMSLERQVRILAGMIVVVGAILALTVDLWFAAIPALVGLGLMFAGITNSCMMGMMLAKMPWNQHSPNPSCSRSPTNSASAQSS